MSYEKMVIFHSGGVNTPNNQALVDGQPASDQSQTWRFPDIAGRWSGFAIITWNNPKHIGETLHHQGTNATCQSVVRPDFPM